MADPAFMSDDELEQALRNPPDVIGSLLPPDPSVWQGTQPRGDLGHVSRVGDNPIGQGIGAAFGSIPGMQQFDFRTHLDATVGLAPPKYVSSPATGAGGRQKVGPPGDRTSQFKRPPLSTPEALAREKRAGQSGGFLDSFVRALANDATLQQADTLAAAMDSTVRQGGDASTAPTWRERYAENRWNQYRRSLADETEHPIATAIGTAVDPNLFGKFERLGRAGEWASEALWEAANDAALAYRRGEGSDDIMKEAAKGAVKAIAKKAGISAWKNRGAIRSRIGRPAAESQSTSIPMDNRNSGASTARCRAIGEAIQHVDRGARGSVGSDLLALWNLKRYLFRRCKIHIAPRPKKSGRLKFQGEIQTS